jgi:L-ribulose-5-phosphate 3-epimerase
LEQKNYSLGLYEKALPAHLSWGEKLKAAKDNAYDFLEISIDETDEKLSRLKMSPAERRSLIETMLEAELPIRTMCLSGHRKYPLGSETPSVRERSLEIMEDALDLAADLGVRIIQLAGYDVYYEKSTEKSRALFFSGLEKAVEMAARRGVALAFETMETEFMNTVGKALFYVQKINSPWLGIYPDYGNITNAAKAAVGSEAEDLRKGSGAIFALHLKETLPGKFREIPFGTGHVDFAGAIKCAFELGVRLFVTEFWHTGEAGYMDTVRSSKNFIDEQFRKAGCLR